jgi:hypothetical protein
MAKPSKSELAHRELEELPDTDLDQINGARGIFESLGSWTGLYSPEAGKALDYTSSLTAGAIPFYGNIYNGVQGVVDTATTAYDAIHGNATWGQVGVAAAAGIAGAIPLGKVVGALGGELEGAAEFGINQLVGAGILGGAAIAGHQLAPSEGGSTAAAGSNTIGSDTSAFNNAFNSPTSTVDPGGNAGNNYTVGNGGAFNNSFNSPTSTVDPSANAGGGTSPYGPAAGNYDVGGGVHNDAGDPNAPSNPAPDYSNALISSNDNGASNAGGDQYASNSGGNGGDGGDGGDGGA